MAMGVLYGLSGPSNVDMSARAYRYGYCRCAWQSWCWQHNRDCWACAFAWSDGFALGVLAAASEAAQSEARVQELYAKWEAELNQAEAAAAAAAQEEELREARAGKKKAKNKSKAGSSGGGQAEKKHVFKFRRVGGR